MNPILEVIVAFLLLLGGSFALIGSWGLARLPSLMTRLHGPTKATTLGVGCIMIASIAWHALLGDGLGLRELLITLFLFITAPISAHLMARAALASSPGNRPDPPADEARARDGAPDDAGAAAREGEPPRD